MVERLRIMPALLLIGLIVTLAAGTPALAQPLALPLAAGSGESEPVVKVLARDDASLELEVQLPSIEVENLEIDGRAYRALTIAGGAIAGEAGEPGLPTFGRLIAVPEGASVSVTILDRRERSLPGPRLLPVQPDGADRFVLNAAAYAPGAKSSRPLVEIGQPAILHGQRVAPVSFSPVAYDPADDEVRVTESLRLRFDYEAAGGPPSARPGHGFLPVSFAQLLAEQVVGFVRSEDVEVGLGTYLLICPDNPSVVSLLQPLVQWRQRQGYHVLLATTAVTGTSTGTIKSYIQSVYDTASPPLEHVVLVGDAGGSISIPCYYESLSGYGGEGDHYYTTLEGDDVLSDVLIGRLSCRSTTELQIIVDKIVSYETDPPMADTRWFTRAGLTGDPRSSGITTVYVNQWLKAQLQNIGYAEIDTIWAGDFPNLMYQTLNKGGTVFGYRGYLGMSQFTTGYISALTNGGMLPFAVIVTCDTGSFARDATSRPEAFLRQSGGGAIGAVGTATIGTHTRYNNCYYHGVWEGAINSGDHRLGAAHNRGKLALYQNYQLAEPYSVEIWSMWNNLMGDPATEMWTAVPRIPVVDHPASLPPGAGAVPVTVQVAGSPRAGLRVCLFKDGEVQVSGLTDAAGRVLLPISGTTAGSLLVTVTGHEIIPYRSQLTLGPVADFVNVSDRVVDDDALGGSSGNADGQVDPGETIELALALENLGADPASGVSATLTTSDPFVTITGEKTNFGDIPAGGTAWGVDSFVFGVAAEAPAGHVIELELVALSAGGGPWTSLIQLPVQSAAFTQLSHTWSGGGTDLDPGEAGALSLEIQNLGDLTATGISATLASDSPWITVTDAEGTFDDMAPGATSENTADPFALSVAPDCFGGHLAAFTLTLDFGGRRASVEFSLPVGTGTPSDPLGPDTFGYYAFDDTDTDYPYAPVYDWIEIDPNHGGSGTDVGLADFGWEQDDTKTLDLPFSFRFYGHDFDRISICSNGWLAMGETTLRFYRNYYLPCAGSPRNIIAPFWDDLHQSGMNRVYAWHDAENHRFIVQWSRMPNYYGAVQNFEAILLDPLYNTTPTGDGEILFQYATVNNSDPENGYASVGIQNGDRSDGLCYTYWNQYPATAAPLAPGRALRFLPLGEFKRPGCQPDPTSISVLLPPGGQTTRTLSVANDGEPGSLLLFVAELADPALGGKPESDPAGGDKSLTGSHLEADLGEFVPGQTYDIALTAYCVSTDQEWIMDVTLDFPPGVSVNSATNMATGSGSLHYVGGFGDGALARWADGYIVSNSTGTASLNVTFGPLGGDVEVPYTLIGDNWGYPPHSISGTLVFTLSGPNVLLAAPNGGEEWGIGETHQIQFAASGGPTEVMIELRRSPESAWETLAPAVPAATGSYDWEVTGPISSECRMRVSDVGDPSVSDTSNEVFTIRHSLLWLGLDRWNGQVPQGQSVDIELSLDATGLAEGTYAADIVLLSNAGAPVVVPVTMQVGDLSAVPSAPEALELAQNHPNPFNPRTTIDFALPHDAAVRLEVFDLKGRRVRSLLSERLPAGWHRVEWDGRDDRGRTLASGQYFYRLRTPVGTITRKMSLLK